MNKEDKKLFDKIERYNIDNEDMPDGAFFALAEAEYDIGLDEWAWYAEQKDKLNNNL